MAKDNRVLVTGLGMLSASGLSVNDTWNSVLAGESSIGEISKWDLSSWPSRLGGQLPEFKAARALPDKKLMKMISKHDAVGICAAVQAVEHSQMIYYRDSLENADEFNDKTAVFVGSPGNKYMQQYDFLPLIAKSNNMQTFADNLFSEVHPMWLLRILPNNVLAYTGITYGFKGVNQNITNHAVSGLQAIIEAYHAIKSGQAERAVVVAYDEAIEPQSQFYYDKLGVLSPNGLSPFDKSHDGTVLAEGAAALVLESGASCSARGVSGIAEVVGGNAMTETAGLFALEEDGEKLASLLSTTMASAAVSADDIGFVVAHGNGNPKSDISEARAISKALADDVLLTGFKWAMGHSVCASGLIDAVLTIKSMQTKTVPGIANFKELSHSCPPLNISANNRELGANQPYAMMINRGFASMNSCLLVKSCE